VTQRAVRSFRQHPSGAVQRHPCRLRLWLKGTPLAARTRANYRRWVVELVEDLAAGDELAAFLSPTGEHERRALLTDWRRRLVDRGLAARPSAPETGPAADHASPSRSTAALPSAVTAGAGTGRQMPIQAGARDPRLRDDLRDRVPLVA